MGNATDIDSFMPLICRLLYFLHFITDVAFIVVSLRLVCLNGTFSILAASSVINDVSLCVSNIQHTIIGSDGLSRTDR